MIDGLMLKTDIGLELCSLPNWWLWYDDGGSSIYFILEAFIFWISKFNKFGLLLTGIWSFSDAHDMHLWNPPVWWWFFYLFSPIPTSLGLDRLLLKIVRNFGMLWELLCEDCWHSSFLLSLEFYENRLLWSAYDFSSLW